jgi:translation elongation factor EF-Ts
MKHLGIISTIAGMIYVYNIRSNNIIKNKINERIKNDNIIQKIISKFDMNKLYIQKHIPKEPYILDEKQVILLYYKNIYLSNEGNRQIIRYYPKLNKNIKSKL